MSSSPTRDFEPSRAETAGELPRAHNPCGRPRGAIACGWHTPELPYGGGKAVVSGVGLTPRRRALPSAENPRKIKEIRPTHLTARCGEVQFTSSPDSTPGPDVGRVALVATSETPVETCPGLRAGLPGGRECLGSLCPGAVARRRRRACRLQHPSAWLAPGGRNSAVERSPASRTLSAHSECTLIRLWAPSGRDCRTGESWGKSATHPSSR